MGLKEVLEKMKLVEAEVAPAAAPAHAPAPPRSPSNPPPAPLPAPRRAAGPPAGARPRLGDMLNGLEKPKVDEAAMAQVAAATDSGGLGEVPDFTSIYQASAVTDPPHGFSAFKVLEILSSADLEGLEPRAKAAALQGFLRMNPSGPVAIGDVIQDAVRRDQALDAFEEFLRKKLEALRAKLDQENEALQQEIDELTRRNKEKMDHNRRALDTEKERFAVWQTRKRVEERRLFDAVAPFVQDNPIRLGEHGGPGTPKPPAS